MTRASPASVRLSNQSYWVVRQREVDQLMSKLALSVEESKHAQSVMLAVAETGKIGSERWNNAQSYAKACLRRTRTLRSRLTRTVYAQRDAIRINSSLAESVPQGHEGVLAHAVQWMQALEALGY